MTATVELCARFARRVHAVLSDRRASRGSVARALRRRLRTRAAVPAVAHTSPLGRFTSQRLRSRAIRRSSPERLRHDHLHGRRGSAAEAVVEPALRREIRRRGRRLAKAKDSDAGAPIKEVPKPDQPRLLKPDRRDLDSGGELQGECDEAGIEELAPIETRRDARKTVGAGSASTKTRIQELNQQFQARMVRGSPTPIADAFADRDDTLRRGTPRPAARDRDPVFGDVSNGDRFRRRVEKKTLFPFFSSLARRRADLADLAYPEISSRRITIG